VLKVGGGLAICSAFRGIGLSEVSIWPDRASTCQSLALFMRSLALLTTNFVHLAHFAHNLLQAGGHLRAICPCEVLGMALSFFPSSPGGHGRCVALDCARSSATTAIAKSRLTGRAASTAAFEARMFVWKRFHRVVLMIFGTFFTSRLNLGHSGNSW